MIANIGRSIVLLAVAAITACAGNTVPDSGPRADKRKIAELNTQIAIEHMRDKDYEMALKKLDKATSTDPNYVDAYNALGVVYNQIGETEKADSNFRRALRLDADNSSALNNYGQFLCQQGDHAKGQEMFVAATDNSLYRTPEIALSNAGVCAMSAGNRGAAEQHFRSALEANPRVPVALLNMAQISFDNQRYLPARGYIQRYTEVARHTAQSLWLGIQVERELGDKDAVASYTLQLEKNFPDSREAGLLHDSS